MCFMQIFGFIQVFLRVTTRALEPFFFFYIISEQIMQELDYPGAGFI